MGQLCLREFPYKIRPTRAFVNLEKEEEERSFYSGKGPHSKVSTKAQVAIQAHVLWLEMLEAKMSHET